MTEQKLKNKLYLITNRKDSSHGELEDIVVQAVKGGVSMVQLREKNTPAREIIDIGLRLQEALEPYNIPLIINDRVDIAYELEAGVHLGQSDVSPVTARRILGEKAIIGTSNNTVEQTKLSDKMPVDYIAVGPMFYTATKEDISEVWNLDDLKALNDIKKPIFAIGGINKTNIKQVLDYGIVSGIAVVSAIFDAEDPQKATQELIGSFNQ